MINVLVVILDILIFYEFVISLFSFKYNEKSLEEYKKAECSQTFSILIACRNEEEVIADNLQAIYDNNYSKLLYSVYVFADNCTDNTAGVCRDFLQSHPDFNLTVVEVQGGSKPKALNLGIKYIKDKGLWKDDNIVILDADNKISTDFLVAYNYYHQESPILQCRILSDNDSSIIAKSFTSSFNTTTHRRQIARNNVHLSGSLSGTGFSINRHVFDEVDFQHCSTLTEDLEFSIMSILKGYSVRFINEQYVLNQNLDEIKPSITQRVRWCRGHMQTSIKLNSEVIKAFCHRPRWQYIDSFLFINSPSITVINTVIFSIVMIFNTDISIWLIVINIIIFVYNLIYNLYCNKWSLVHLLTGVHFTFFMYFAIMFGTFTYRNNTWAKTTHKQINHTLESSGGI